MFLTDFDWLPLSDRDDVGGRSVRYELEQEIARFQALAGYRVFEKSGELNGGAEDAGSPRCFDTDAWLGLVHASLDDKLDLQSEPRGEVPAQERTIRAPDDWAAPYLALRLKRCRLGRG